jgi:hypothetical protein
VGLPRQVRNSRFLSVPKFKNSGPIGCQQPRKVGKNRAVAIETISAAIKRG